MYQSESMIQMLEDMQHQANEMEKSIKDMLEVEGRAIGIELDKRKNARDLFNELSEKQIVSTPVEKDSLSLSDPLSPHQFLS